MTTTTRSTTFVTIQPSFNDAEPLALAGYLAAYRPLTRETYALDHSPGGRPPAQGDDA